MAVVNRFYNLAFYPNFCVVASNSRYLHYGKQGDRLLWV